MMGSTLFWDVLLLKMSAKLGTMTQREWRDRLTVSVATYLARAAALELQTTIFVCVQLAVEHEVIPLAVHVEPQIREQCVLQNKYLLQNLREPLGHDRLRVNRGSQSCRFGGRFDRRFCVASLTSKRHGIGWVL